MKRISVILFLFTMFSAAAFAQGFYARLHSGYGVATATQNAYDLTRVDQSSEIYHYNQKVKSFSYGSGMYYSAALGYMINQNIGLDVELQYFRGSNSTYYRDYTYSAPIDGREVANFENYGESFMVTPSFMLKTNLGQFRPYFKVGPIISFPGISNRINSTFTSKSNVSRNVSEEVLYDGGMAYGINAAAGAGYEILSNIEIFFELNNKSMSYAPEKGEIKKYLVDGVDKLYQIDQRYRKMEFVENYYMNSQADPNDNKPMTQPKTDMPFSSLTFSVGLTYSF